MLVRIKIAGVWYGKGFRNFEAFSRYYLSRPISKFEIVSDALIKSVIEKAA